MKTEFKIYEPGLEELVHRNVGSGRLYFSTSAEEACQNADIIFVGTCIAFDILELEALNKLKELISLGKKIISYGCMSSYAYERLKILGIKDIICSWDDNLVEELINNLDLRDHPRHY
jgi:tRNA A37 methylthiotransferase MiaB